MASIRKRNGKWQVQVRRKESRIRIGKIHVEQYRSLLPDAMMLLDGRAFRSNAWRPAHSAI